MLDVLTAEDVRRQDAASEARGVSVELLMEQAGHAVARAARGLLGATYGQRVLIVCGKGNNAGDGLVAGRWLAQWGAHVTAIRALPGEMSDAATEALSYFPGRVEEPVALEREIGRADLIIDALFGVGLSRAPEGDAQRAIDTINAAPIPVISIDLPSGMNADTGATPGAWVRADGIVTLGGLKPGLLFRNDCAGWIEVADIGVAPEDRIGSAFALEPGDIAQIMPVRGAMANKRRSGIVLVVAGSRAMPGAAALTTAACVHAGAGLTTLAAPERVTAIALSRIPEITTIPLSENAEGTLDMKEAESILSRAPEFGAIAIGPGISRHPAAAEAVRMIVERTGAPLVLDADGLNAFEGDAAALASREGFVVCTPHEGEASRLIGMDAAQIAGDRLAAARSIAAKTNHAVLLKGAGTVVTAPDANTYINMTGNRGLAQGGTGDVLTGIIASLLAQAGPDATDAQRLEIVAAAAWLQGRAADIAAERFAPHPANASLLIELLPEVVHEVFSGS